MVDFKTGWEIFFDQLIFAKFQPNYSLNFPFKVDEEAVTLLAELRDKKLPAVLDNSRIWTSSAEGYVLSCNVFDFFQ